MKEIKWVHCYGTTGGKMAGVGPGCHGWPPTGEDFCINSEGLGFSSEDARCTGFLLLL